MRRLTTYLTVALACTIAVPPAGQIITDMGTGGGGSPHVKAEWTLDGAAIAIEYGRPSVKGRRGAADAGGTTVADRRRPGNDDLPGLDTNTGLFLKSERDQRDLIEGLVASKPARARLSSRQRTTGKLRDSGRRSACSS